MNTAIADAFDLSWKLAFVARGIADPALLDSYEAERGPIGRRNVAMSMAPAGGGSDDGLAEDLGSLVASPRSPSTRPPRPSRARSPSRRTAGLDPGHRTPGSTSSERGSRHSTCSGAGSCC
jgi:2-polyprenyl-6-methoxyphenol hydroxylase-like FAD-dependent oxidoreductase